MTEIFGVSFFVYFMVLIDLVQHNLKVLRTNLQSWIKQRLQWTYKVKVKLQGYPSLIEGESRLYYEGARFP